MVMDGLIGMVKFILVIGWIRVNYDIPYCANKITQAQYNKCKELNIKRTYYGNKM